MFKDLKETWETLVHLVLKERKENEVAMDAMVTLVSKVILDVEEALVFLDLLDKLDIQEPLDQKD